MTRIMLFVMSWAMLALPGLHALDLVDDAEFRQRALKAEAEAQGDPNQLLMVAGQFMDARDYAHAEAIYRGIVARYAVTHPMIFSNLSVFLGKQGKYAEALAMADRALAMAPGDLHATAVKASWLYESGRTEEGLRLFASIPVPSSGSKATLYQGCVACFYASVGDVGRIKDAIAALRQDPESMTFIRRDVVFDRYRREPWFIDLVGRTVSEPAAPALP